MLIATGVSLPLLDAPASASSGRGIVLRRRHERGQRRARATTCRRRRGELRRPGGGQPRSLRARVVMLVRSRFAREVDVALPGRADPAHRATSKSGSRPRSSAGRGDGHLEASTVRTAGGTEQEVATNWLFVFIGAPAPHRLAR